MSRRCSRCRSYVPDHEAQLVAVTEAGSGPSIPAYACPACVRTHGLVPPAHLGPPSASAPEERQHT